MKVTMELKLLPDKQTAALLDFTMAEYISLVNDILDYAIACGKMPELSSKNLRAPLPSALKDQCRLDAKSIYSKVTKPNSKLKGRFPTLRKPVSIWNNQNYKVGVDYVAMPLFVNGKSHKTKISAIVPDEALKILQSISPFSTYSKMCRTRIGGLSFFACHNAIFLLSMTNAGL